MLKAIFSLFYYKTAHFSAYNFLIHCKIKWIEKKFQKMGVTFKSLLTMCDVLRNTPANPTNQFQIRHIGNDTAKLDKTFIDFVINYKHAEQNYKAVFCKSL